MARVPPPKRQSTPTGDETTADANNEAMKDPKSLAGKRSNKTDSSNYMNITVKREKLESAEQIKQLQRECEFMIIDGKAENLYDSEEIIEIENSDEGDTMDVETEKRMMSKFHKKQEKELQLIGTHWYMKDGEGGVNPTALVKPPAAYTKSSWKRNLRNVRKRHPH